MSGRRLPRGTGTVITCGQCRVTSTTGQIHVGLHRAWLLASQGWMLATAPTRAGRPLRGDDLCPACITKDMLDAAWHAFMARRIASRKRWRGKVSREQDTVAYEDGTLTPLSKARAEFELEALMSPRGVPLQVARRADPAARRHDQARA